MRTCSVPAWTCHSLVAPVDGKVLLGPAGGVEAGIRPASTLYLCWAMSVSLPMVSCGGESDSGPGALTMA